MDFDVAVLAGAVSTIIFASSVMPMLYKASKTRDLTSYSMGNLLLSNVGNLVHSVYVYNLPAGPIWVMHSFYLVATAYMLWMYLRHGRPSTGSQPAQVMERVAGGRAAETAVGLAKAKSV